MPAVLPVSASQVSLMITFIMNMVHRDQMVRPTSLQPVFLHGRCPLTGKGNCDEMTIST